MFLGSADPSARRTCSIVVCDFWCPSASCMCSLVTRVLPSGRNHQRCHFLRASVTPKHNVCMRGMASSSSPLAHMALQRQCQNHPCRRAHHTGCHRVRRRHGVLHLLMRVPEHVSLVSGVDVKIITVDVRGVWTLLVEPLHELVSSRPSCTCSRLIFFTAPHTTDSESVSPASAVSPLPAPCCSSHTSRR